MKGKELILIWGTTKNSLIQKIIPLLNSYSEDVYFIAGNNNRCVTSDQLMQTLGNNTIKIIENGNIKKTFK